MRNIGLSHSNFRKLSIKNLFGIYQEFFDWFFDRANY